MPVFALNAESLIRQGNWPALESLARRWIGTDPTDAGAWRHLSRAAFETGRYRLALDAFRKVLDCSDRTAANLTTYGRIAMHALEFETAAAALTEAEVLDPRAPELLAARALLLTYHGRFNEAETYCRRCLDCSPEFVPAYTTLSRLINGRFSDREMAVLSRVSQQQQTPLDYRIPAAFALAHAYDARQDTSAAFSGYEYAHALCNERNRREGRSYDPVRTAERMDRLMALLGSVDEETDPLPDNRATPIFIVGMPRSGTTLIESVLAAHSHVRAGGERPHMQQILSAYLRLRDGNGAHRPEPDLLKEWREAYFADVTAGGTVDHFTDKQPLNFEAAGLIARMFPEAIIIHVRRNPIETAFSIFRNEFSKFWAFTNRLEDIGHYYGQYARLTSHWERVLGQRFHTIQYEDFAGNFDTAAPALVAACGLDWEEQCRNFQSVARAIPTLSAVQVREAVRARTGSADRYMAHLGRLVDALNAAGVNLATGRTWHLT